MHVSHFQAQRPDRERALQGLHFLSPDSPWVWPLGHLAAEGVFEPGPGVLDVPGPAVSLRMSNRVVCVTRWKGGGGVPHPR